MKTIITKIIRKIKRVLKRHHLLPVYPIDILIEAKQNFAYVSGICSALKYAAQYFKFYDVAEYAPYIEKLDRNIAIQNFNGDDRKDTLYWWKPGIWRTGRLDFLNFLIEENKNNKIDLRKITL